VQAQGIYQLKICRTNVIVIESSWQSIDS